MPIPTSDKGAILTEEPNYETASAAGLERITTGNAQLDDILGGGFPVNSINILMGEPGSGKTILAERLMFANAGSAERPIVFLTTLSEPLEKVIRYLQQFDFYDEEQLAKGAIVYDSLGDELESQGLDSVVPKLKTVIKDLSPKIIIIDSFKAIHDLSTSIPQMRRMLYEVSGLLAAYQTTAFFIGEYDQNMISVLPEFAVADAMVELARHKSGTRDERYLRVLKLRGSGYQEGLHAFRLGPAGLDVFPRLKSPSLPADYDKREKRASTGIAVLDDMLGGGMWAGSTTLIQGPTGSGKTTLGLQFILEGLKRGEHGLYLNFQENPTQLKRQIYSLGWDLDDPKSKGLTLSYCSPVELQIDSILVGLFRKIEENNIKRVVIDAVDDLVSSTTDHYRLLGYLYALAQHFVVRRISSLMTMELAQSSENRFSGKMSAISDAILRLDVDHQGDIGRRTIRIVKARGVSHDLNTRVIRITSDGLRGA